MSAATTNHNDTVLEQFTQQAEGYANLTNAMAPERQSPIITLTSPNAEDRVLDVACGPAVQQFMATDIPLDSA